MTWEQVTGLVGAIGGIGIGVLGYRRSRQVDEVSAQSGAASETREGIARAFADLNTMLDQVQEDNKELRAGARIDTKEFKETLQQCSARVMEVLAERDQYKQERDEARLEFITFRQSLEK